MYIQYQNLLPGWTAIVYLWRVKWTREKKKKRNVIEVINMGGRGKFYDVSYMVIACSCPKWDIVCLVRHIDTVCRLCLRAGASEIGSGRYFSMRTAIMCPH